MSTGMKALAVSPVSDFKSDTCDVRKTARRTNHARA